MRRLFLDLETAYTIGAVWGMWEQNVAQVLQDEYILGVGWQWAHQDTVYWKGLPDFPGYAKNKKSDKELMKFIAGLLNGADVVIAHNGKSFDMKKIRSRMLYHGLPPINEPKIVDTKLVVKKHFNFPSNKLDELSRVLLGERKVKHEGIELWTKCMAGDLKAWKRMATYCKQDVVLLRKLYELCVPWMDNHPNWNLFGDRPPSCPNCGYAGIYKHGFRYNVTTVQQKYKCSRCKHMFAGEGVKRSKIR